MKRHIIYDDVLANNTIAGLFRMGTTFDVSSMPSGGWQLLIAENRSEANQLSQLRKDEIMHS